MVNSLSESLTPNTFLLRLRTSTLVVLVFATAIILIRNPPSTELFSLYLDKIAVYAFLTAVSLFLAVLLSESELSAAHVVGMMAFLA